jgi:hypothetical protein
VLVGLVTGIGATRLRAQAEQTAPQSPGEAATLFISILTRDDSLSQSREMPQLFAMQKQLSVVEPALLDRLIERFHHHVRLAEWKADVALDSSGDTASVQVEQAPPAGRLKPVACVAENNVWRVDLLKTARIWFGVDDALVKQLQEELNDDGRLALRDCQSNLRQIAFGLKLYLQDYDEKYPPADKWCDVMRPYVKNEAVFNCPATIDGKLGYAMNWKLSRTPATKVANPGYTVLIYEASTLAWNQCSDGADLAFRHTQRETIGANYAYTDGHIKWQPKEETQNFRLLPPPVKLPSSPRPAFPPPAKTPRVAERVVPLVPPAPILPSRGQFPRQLRQPRR